MASRVKQNMKKKEKAGVSAVPLARSRKAVTGKPVIRSSSKQGGDGRVRIRHREYLADIVGSVAFASNSYSVNPGLPGTFPWLSTLAQNFESYLFHKLSFDFETQKSASTSGSLMMAIDYDASDAAPQNKQQLMAYHHAVRSAVWDECSFRGDRQDLKKFGVQRYVRSGSLAANLDVKTYDVGTLFVATQGEADTTAIGELYVDYDVELITPQSNREAVISNSAFITTTAASRAAPFTGTQTIVGGLSVTATGATMTFGRVGKYWLAYQLTGTVTTATAPTLTGTATSLQGGFLPSAQLSNAAATAASSGVSVVVNNVGETVIFDFTASCTTLTALSVQVAGYATA